METEPTNVVISAYVPKPVADAIKRLAKKEERTTSKVAGRILSEQVTLTPEPEAKFSRRKGKKVAA